MAMVYIGFHISGAHYNPAVSFAMFILNRMHLHEMLKYIGAQIVGALPALGLFTIISDVLFSPEIRFDYPLIVSTGMETLLTFVLILVILTIVLLDRYKSNTHGIVMGLTLMAIVSIGGIFNPAVAVASIIVNVVGDGIFVGLYPVVVYIIGPCIASIVAAHSFRFLNEK
jgi:aquaporin Z